MSNPDKHKPLSAEELFKLLDNTSNKSNDFDEMDDFEKEALEGFSAHSNAQKAKALTDELNFAISKKAAESNKGGTKNKVIWFSAAASIVLVIMISVFFFTQTKEDSVTNIALNEVKKDKAPESFVEESKTIEATEVTRSTPNTKDATQSNESAQKKSLKDQTVLYDKNAEGESLAGAASPISATAPAGGEYRSENKPTALISEKAAKDESKNRSDYDIDDLKQKEGIVSDNLETKKKEKATISQEQAREESLTSQTFNTVALSNSAAAINNNKGTKEEDGYYKADAEKSVTTKKSLEKERAAKPVTSSYDKSSAVTETASGKTATAPSSGIVGGNISSKAYYIGSELAIRDYVLEFLSKKSGSVIVTGKYKITGNVSVKGELSIITIIQISSENCHCTEQIKEALNSMTKWNPAVEDGKKVSSKVEFIVVF